MSRTLKLSKERADQLRALTKEAVDASTAKWRVREEESLADMDEQRRQTLLHSKEIYLVRIPDEAPEEMPVWNTGLKKILSADERKRLKDEAGEHATRCGHALARIMVVEIDARVALTGKQREELEPICDRLVAKDLEMLSPLVSTHGGGFQYLDVVAMLATSLKPPVETEVQAILEPIQWRHWLDACDESIRAPRRYVVSDSARQAEQKPALPADPEDYERMVANYLDEKAEIVRQKALAVSLLWAEDAGRASSLPADKVEQLKTAARGAVEESMSNWKTNIDATVRANVGDGPVRVVQAGLQRLDGYNFAPKLHPPPETQAIWTDALKATLDTQQAAAAAKSASEREAFRNESTAAFVVAAFDQSHHLTTAQQAALTTAVEGATKEYLPDIQGYFSGGGNEWFLSSYYMFVPIAAVAETDFKSIVGPECFDLWSRSPEFTNCMLYWSNIKEVHDNRVKANAQK